MPARKPAATSKKTTVKSVSAKIKSAPRKQSTTRPKPITHRSFRLSSETEKFISSRITIQTVYWLILGVAILVMSLFVLKAQLEILETLNQISESL